MPVPDPIPSPRRSTMQRFWHIFRLLALLAIVIAAISVLLVARGDPAPLAHVHMLIATALGIGLTVLVGTGLMTLVFISNSSGHDDAAANFHEENDKE
jgi:NAD/NADP transhydrogenase beta subunit